MIQNIAKSCERLLAHVDLAGFASDDRIHDLGGASRLVDVTRADSGAQVLGDDLSNRFG